MPPGQLTTTDDVCSFLHEATFEMLSDTCVRRITDAITDAIGVGVAGGAAECDPVASVLEPQRPPARGIPLLGRSERASPAAAALYNGTAIHALDFDDVNHPSYAHPSAHLLPVILSAVDEPGADGPSAILAYALGLEIGAWLGASLNTGDEHPQDSGHYAHGWHSTGTFGSLGATAAAAKLLRLDPRQLPSAIAIGASSASGLRVNFGSMVKPLHAGLAARNGLLAAQLARVGVTGSDAALEGRFGYVDVFGEPGIVMPPIGPEDVWAAESEFGLALKPYPTCGATHPAIEAALSIGESMDWREIEQVRVGTNQVASTVLLYPDPQTPGQAKFSMPFCVAAALVLGRIDLATVAGDALWDADVRSVMKRIDVEIDDRVRYNPEHGAVVSAVARDGRREERLVEVAKGKPERWSTTAEQRAKFESCVAPVMGDSRATETFEAWQGLPSATSLAELTEMLVV